MLPSGSWVQCPGHIFRIAADGADCKYVRKYPLWGVLVSGSDEALGQTKHAVAARYEVYAAAAAID